MIQSGIIPYTKDKMQSLIVMLCGTIALLVTSNGHTLTLYQALIEQLGVEPESGNACGVLLGNDSLSVITGTLATICARNVPAGRVPSAGAIGAGSATPTTLPSVVKRRMQETDEESGGGASADASVVLGGGWGVFLSAESESQNRDNTIFEDGYDSDVMRVTAGIDFRINNQMVAGLAIDGYNHKGDFDSGGKFESDGKGVLLFASFSPVDSVFMQAYAGYSGKSNKRQRFTRFTEDSVVISDGFVGAEYDGNEYSMGIMAGYDRVNGATTISPRASLDWLNSQFDHYDESGNTGLELTFEKDERTSLQSAVGVQVSHVVSTTSAIFVPQSSIDWKHEFDEDQRNVSVSFVDDTRSSQFTFETENPDRNFFELNVGVAVIFTHGAQLFVNYRTLLGHSFYNNTAATIGFRLEL